jgi:hydroxymethylglutaryl-CoA reductase (NADPH)
VEPRKWPRKNDAESIQARQEALGLDGEVTGVDLEPFTRAQEMLTGAAVIPVAVVGPLEIELGEYELHEPDGAVVETGRARDSVFVPLAHTEGGLSASLHRGARAVAESGGFRTYVLADRITRASCFVCGSAAEAIELAHWIEDELDAMREWLEQQDDPSLSKFARLREVKTHVLGPMCHVLWRWTTGDAVGANMMTRNAYVLNMGYVMARAPVTPERSILEANMGGDKKPSFEYFQSGHGKTVVAEATLTEDAVRRVLRTKLEDLEELAWAGTHGSVASGMQSVAFTPATAIARSSPPRARTSGWSAPARCATAPNDGSRTACRSRSASPGSRWRPSAAAPRSRSRAAGSSCSAVPAPARSTASRRSSPRRRSRWRSPRRPRWPPPLRGVLPGAPRARWPSLGTEPILPAAIEQLWLDGQRQSRVASKRRREPAP